MFKSSSPKYIEQTLKRQQIQSANKRSPNNYGWATMSRNVGKITASPNFNPLMKWKNIPDVVLSVPKSILVRHTPHYGIIMHTS